jgi:phage terminase small subunit
MAPKSKDINKKGADLSQKQEVFIREYLIDGNGARAAEAAGYGKNSAAVTASRLLRNAKVREKLGGLTSEHLEKLEITAEKVLQGLAELAYFDPRKMYNQDGTFKKIHEMDEATVHALTGADVEKLFKHFGKGQAEEIGTITKVRYADRGLNLERLGRHLKLFTDKFELNDAQAIVAKLQQGRARVAALKKK